MAEQFIHIIVGDDKILAFHCIENYLGYNKFKTLENIIEDRSKFSSTSFLGNSETESKIFVTYDAVSLVENPDIWEAVKTGKYTHNKILIVLLPDVDSRTKFFKEFKDLIIKLDEYASGKIQGQTPKIGDVVPNELNDCFSRELFYLCSRNYTKFHNEVLKIKCLSEANGITQNEACELLKKGNKPAIGMTDDPFKVVESFMSKNFFEFFRRFSIYSGKSFDFGLWSLIYSNIRNLFIYKASLKNNSLSKSGLTPYIIKLVSPYVDNFSLIQLVNAMKFMQKIDCCEKQGKISADNSSDYVAVQLVRKITNE